MLPIDVHCAKLVDWLVQRRHCKKDWGENLSSIRRKIKAALKDMPESEDIRLLLTGSKLDYFKSKRIVEILRTTEADTKNIFGYYSSQRMKDWQDIVSSYERDSVYLAEIATDLIRETNYEIPGIKKVIQRLQKEKEVAEKEKATQLRRAQQFNAEYQKLARTYGIKGINVIHELNEQSKDMVNVMNEIVTLAKQLDTGLEFYRDFAKSTQQDSAHFLPTLEYIIKKGNTTVYEWKNGEAPERVIIEESAPDSVENSNPSEIDFGDDLAETHSTDSSNGFVLVENNEDTPANLNEKVAMGEDSKLLLESQKSRNLFLNNIFELDAFYKQLATEGQSDTLRMSVSDVNVIRDIIRQIVDIVSKERNRVLFQKSSFIASVNERFASKAKQASNCFIKAELADERIRNLMDQIQETEVHLKRSVSASKELQKRVEACLSELYQGRIINIMGC